MLWVWQSIEVNVRPRDMLPAWRWYRLWTRCLTWTHPAQSSFGGKRGHCFPPSSSYKRSLHVRLHELIKLDKHYRGSSQLITPLFQRILFSRSQDVRPLWRTGCLLVDHNTYYFDYIACRLTGLRVFGRSHFRRLADSPWNISVFFFYPRCYQSLPHSLHT